MDKLVEVVIAIVLAIVMILNPPQYKNCDEARADYPSGISSNDPGYGRHLDKDGDGRGRELK